MPAVVFQYELRLYGADHPRDRLFDPAFGGDPRDRVFSWRYEILSEADPANAYPDADPDSPPANAHPHPNQDQDADQDTHTDRNTYSHAHLHPHPHTNADP